MLFYQEMSYTYTRIKNIEESNGTSTLFLYVELALYKRQVTKDVNRQQVQDVVSEIIRVPLEEAPKEYKELEDGELYLDISKETFEKLKILAIANFIAFASYSE
ncbi:hypothetical protein MKZ20_21780 [Psychrobacillus sp. FSL K6-2684]|uniref:hypothetical protein n=2 Tax=Psychrobacillus TaxID=1221880 RepID=UPI0030FB65CE